MYPGPRPHSWPSFVLHRCCCCCCWQSLLLSLHLVALSELVLLHRCGVALCLCCWGLLEVLRMSIIVVGQQLGPASLLHMVVLQKLGHSFPAVALELLLACLAWVWLGLLQHLHLVSTAVMRSFVLLPKHCVLAPEACCAPLLGLVLPKVLLQVGGAVQLALSLLCLTSNHLLLPKGLGRVVFLYLACMLLLLLPFAPQLL